VTFICTDTHAELNGHPSRSTGRYFEEVQREAAQRGFGARLLSDLVFWAEDRVDEGRALERPSPEILRGLIASAAKWYAGGRSAEEGAELYYGTNMSEKHIEPPDGLGRIETFGCVNPLFFLAFP
jgi:L-tyrosine isonitrile synthase